VGKFKYNRSTRVSDMDFDSLLDQLSTDLDDKIHRFRLRKARQFGEDAI
jgi:hypothetical protein